MYLDSCPDGWFLKGKRCYYFVMDLHEWNDARENCESMGDGVYLAEPRQRGTMDALCEEANILDGGYIYWVGGYWNFDALHGEGRWDWYRGRWNILS